KIEEALNKDAAAGRMHAGITLYIAGHTDTVGSGAHNFKVSQDRARSIAGWFRKRGVKIPISYEGFGETTPVVKTADNIDEVRNRRADYVLSDGPPPLSSSFHAPWKRITERAERRPRRAGSEGVAAGFDDVLGDLAPQRERVDPIQVVVGVDVADLAAPLLLLEHPHHHLAQQVEH